MSEYKGWSEEACIAAIRQAAERLGHGPSIREFEQQPGPSPIAVKRVFGDWNDALTAAGYALDFSGRVEVEYPDDLNPLHQRAYARGYRHGYEGRLRSACQYSDRAGAKHHRNAWIRGWQAARERIGVGDAE